MRAREGRKKVKTGTVQISVPLDTAFWWSAIDRSGHIVAFLMRL
ncbi:MAG: hypothetical protein ACJAUP_000297 [Cellvibrionaceae bacterium]|jgi:hypothetical protein